MHIGAEVRVKLHLGKFSASNLFVILSPNGEPCKTLRARAAKNASMISPVDKDGVWEWTFPSFRCNAEQECILDLYERKLVRRPLWIGSARLSFCSLTADTDVAQQPCSVIKQGREAGILWVSIHIALPHPELMLKKNSCLLSSLCRSPLAGSSKFTSSSRILSSSTLGSPPRFGSPVSHRSVSTAATQATSVNTEISPPLRQNSNYASTPNKVSAGGAGSNNSVSCFSGIQEVLRSFSM